MESRFVQAVQAGLKGLTAVSTGFLCECSECIEYSGYCCEHAARAAMEDGDIDQDSSFSSSSCDCCNSHLAGDRYAAHGINDTESIVHLEVCADCVLFIANGDEPEA